MKKNKTNKIIILSLIGVVFIVSLLIFILNYSKDDSSFSILEKKWINDNSNNVIDVSVYNDVPIFGSNGNGVIFDFLDEFSSSYGISFNKISYISDNDSTLGDIAFKVLESNGTLGKNDILIYTDNYILISKGEESIDRLSDINNATLGVLNGDISNVNYYLNDINNISYTPYNNIDELVIALNNDLINYAVIPRNSYMDVVLKYNYHILYHFNDLFRNYVLTINNNKTLYNIMRKFELQFSNDNFEESYKKNFVRFFFTSKNITEEDQSSYNANSYTYGYVVNMPFENTENGEFLGIISNYLSGMEDLFDIDFRIIKYEKIAELKSALSSGEIDVAFANFPHDELTIDTIKTMSLFKEEYVLLSKNYMIIDSIRSLKDLEVYTVSNTYLANYLKDNSVKVKGYNNTDELLRNIGSDSLIIIDKATYTYYKTGKLANYKVLYEDTLANDYQFIIRDVNKNTTFSELFKYYVESVNYNSVKYQYNTTAKIVDTGLFGTTLKYIFGALVVVLVILIIIIVIIKKKKRASIIKKEEKLKFIDIMTSLKNRNYLNYNINKWEENIIYPQAFVVIDLNNIKYINDNHGHEEGDNVIKKAASILIISQLEKTDIMRTDGNEFLIYMIGYSETQVIEYTRKLYKDLKELPYGFGASIGYSMITDDVKTIDDAINEATLEMRSAKEKI